MRTEEIIVSMYSIITGKDDYKEIHNTLLRSLTFREVLKRNEALLYEGYASNLLDIAQELTDAGVLEAKMITPDAIKIVNRARKYEAGKRSVLKAANGNELLKSHDDDNLGSKMALEGLCNKLRQAEESVQKEGTISSSELEKELGI